MPAKLLKMKIMNNGCEPAFINIYDEHKNSLGIHYYRSKNILRYLEQNNLFYFIRQNQYQVLKILNSKRSDSFYQGFELEFVIIPDFYFVKNEDFNDYIIVDRRKKHIAITIQKERLENIHEIYTDGSYFNLNNKSGCAFILRYPNGKEKLFQEKLKRSGNNFAELTAVESALVRLKNELKIRIYTDSRYVIKGLAQWIHYWKINHWKTVHNDNVKHAETWINCEKLTQNKHLEFKWVKGHSNHFENSLCDLMAKDAARKIE